MNANTHAFRAVLSAALLLGGSAALAAEDLQARAWAATCAACHGTTGNANTGIPPIAGQDAQRLYTALKEFKEDKRAATVMHQHAKGYTDDELQRLANYFARQKP